MPAKRELGGQSVTREAGENVNGRGGRQEMMAAGYGVAPDFTGMAGRLSPGSGGWINWTASR
ncbi:MAG TPA: hypothetical protein VKS82_22210 [Streptosporangiaceae bacterium]|nr:hypothetical protein [Streptosporangiaceae bacterium]